MQEDVKISLTIDGIPQQVKNLDDLKKKVSDLDKETEKAAKSQGFFSKQSEAAKERLDGFKATLGEIRTGIANGFKGLVNFAKGFRTAGGAAKNFGRITKAALAATGIGLLITAVVSLIEYFQNLEGGARAIQKVLQGIGATFSQLGKAFSSLIKGDFKGMREAIKGIGSAVTEAVEAVDNQFDAEARLSKLRQETIVQNAKLNQEIEKQKKILEDTTLSTEKRLAALDKVNAATKELQQNQIAETEEALRVAQAQLTLENNFEARRQKQEEIAELQAQLIDQQTTLQTIEYDAARVAREIRQQEADEKAAAAEKEAEERQKKQEEEQRLADEAAAKELERRTALDEALAEADQQKLLLQIEDAATLAQEQLRIEEEQALAELDLLGATEEEKQKIRELFGAKREKLAKEVAKSNNEIQKAEFDAAVDVAASAFSAIASLAGESSAVGKAAAVAATVINTYKGAQSAFADTPGGPVIKSIAAGVAVAAGLANVQKILSTPVPGGDSAGGGVSVPRPTAPTVPTIDPQAALEQTQGLQDAGPDVTLDQGTATSGATIKAYVVSEEMTSKQEADKKINDLAKL